MIQSCKFCMSQRHMCPRCEGPVLVRTINMIIPESRDLRSTSVILCTNLECQNYGEFKLQTVDSIEPYVCDSCKSAQEYYKSLVKE